MKTTRFAILFAALLVGPLLSGGGAAVGMSLQGTTTNPTGVVGVVTASGTYDVSFNFAAYDTTFATDTPLFLGNGAAALDASESLGSAMRALDVSGLNGATCAITDLPCGLAIFTPSGAVPGVGIAGFTIYTGPCKPPYMCVWETLAAQSVPNPSGPDFLIEFEGVPVPSSVRAYAVWAPTVVPVPGALVMFAPALAGLGFLRRLRAAQV